MTTTTRVITIPFKRGTTAQNDAYTGTPGEVTIDATLRTLRVHDGLKQGGEPLLRKQDLQDVTAQVTAAQQSATDSATSASQSAASATSAQTSATNAATSETNAAASAQAAANSQGSAAQSASDAAASAANISTAESNASASASAAATSASDAATSAAAAQAVARSYNKTWLGNLAADPATDNNGDPLVAGAEYFNTTENKIRVYDGAAWGDYDATAQTATQNAQLSASNAAASESNALSYKNSAQTSASNAATSESNTLAYRNDAQTAAANAATSESNAASSATAAANSATDASNSATAAANSAQQASDTLASKASLSGADFTGNVSAPSLIATSVNIGGGASTGSVFKSHAAANSNLEILTPNSGSGVRVFARDDAGTLNRLELQGGSVVFPLTTGADGLVYDAANDTLKLGTATGTGKLDLYASGTTRIGFGVDMGGVFGNSAYTNTAFNWGSWDGTTFTQWMKLDGSKLSTVHDIQIGAGQSFLFGDYSSGVSGSALSGDGTQVQVYTAGNLRATIDASGNFGLGVTPSAIWSGGKALQINSGGTIMADAANMYLSSNSYYDGTNWRYQIGTASARYDISGGTHTWFVAPSGPAGGNITYTQVMQLDSSGNFLKIQNGAYTGYLGSSSTLVSGGATTDMAVRSDGDLVFATGGARYAGKFDTSGNLLVGVTSGAARIVSSGITQGLPSATGTTAEAAIRIQNGGNTPVLDMGVDTDATNASWIQARRSSDYATNYNLLLQPNGGNVGFGLSAPNYKAQIYGASSDTGLSTNPLFVLTNDNYGAGTGASIGFTFADTSLIGASVTGRSLQSAGGGYLTLETRDSTGVLGERLRADHTGVYVGGLYAGGIGQDGPALILPMGGTLQRSSQIKSYTPSTAPGIDYVGLRITTNNGASNTVDALDIDPAGNVFVGTTLNQGKLSVGGTIAAMDSSGAYLTQMYSSAGDSVIAAYSGSGQSLSLFVTPSGSGATRAMRLNSARDWVSFETASTVGYIGKADTLTPGGPSNRLGIRSDTDMEFIVSAGTFAAQFGSDGTFAIGTRTSSGKLTVDNLGHANTAIYAKIDQPSGQSCSFTSAFSGTSGSAYHVLFYYGATAVGSITSDASTTAYNTTSDYRLKEVQSQLVGSLDLMMQVPLYSYLWKSTGLRGEGALAHDIQALFPYAVTGDKDGINVDGSPLYQGVDWSKLVPRLIGSLQELKQEFDSYVASHP